MAIYVLPDILYSVTWIMNNAINSHLKKWFSKYGAREFWPGVQQGYFSFCCISAGENIILNIFNML
jgi:hypothetical protein